MLDFVSLLDRSRQAPMKPAQHDRFRGTLQRWIVENGPLAGTACDHAFNEDWSLTWRMTMGPAQGQVGRARVFRVQPVRSQLFLVCFARTASETVTAAVDFASLRFAGFYTGPERCDPVSGAVRIL